MCGAGREPHTPQAGDDGRTSDTVFTALLEDSVVDLYENAPCGHLSTLLDGTIAKVNATLLTWLGYRREDVVGRMRFADLLTVGGKLYHETHFAPLLSMQGEVRGIALELRTADGSRLPVLVTSTVKRSEDGAPMLIRTTISDARERRAYEEELLRGRRKAEEAQQRAEQDRAHLKSVLATLQQSLLPPVLPEVPGLEVAAQYHIASADHLGGDFYDLFSLGDGRFGFFLGDVCGKGPEAAAVTSLARYTLRAAAVHDGDPVVVLSTLNTVLSERYSGGDPRYCTTVFGVLQALEPGGDRFEVTVASGGHPPAIVTRGTGAAEYLPTPGGVLVGIFPDAGFTAARTVLGPGDTLLLYTDGLTEARTPAGRFGDEALLALTEELAPASAPHLVKALADLLGGFGDGLDDDTALLALSVPAPSPKKTATANRTV
ncbi:SpoIIE family protein phosphatase [Streptomyces sp. 549]|uniref:PP2C family protein-serine/threonine phosphatase n=1 Tax=Streptomyces sp. 549 TaxID=3049076 RepID=UPI0024C382E7|nr:SpoIIE family protein phosphatase [Streptomyces sp. 549]MDK1475847.1 SpoIIE family protein phosphatase [Streptomyces sp. 549]